MKKIVTLALLLSALCSSYVAAGETEFFSGDVSWNEVIYANSSFIKFEGRKQETAFYKDAAHTQPADADWFQTRSSYKGTALAPRSVFHACELINISKNHALLPTFCWAHPKNNFFEDFSFFNAEDLLFTDDSKTLARAAGKNIADRLAVLDIRQVDPQAENKLTAPSFMVFDSPEEYDLWSKENKSRIVKRAHALFVRNEKSENFPLVVMAIASDENQYVYINKIAAYRMQELGARFVNISFEEVKIVKVGNEYKIATKAALENALNKIKKEKVLSGELLNQ